MFYVHVYDSTDVIFIMYKTKRTSDTYCFTVALVASLQKQAALPLLWTTDNKLRMVPCMCIKKTE